MMHLFLRFYSGFLAALLLFGGTYLRTRLGKIEIGSLEPFFLIFLTLLLISGRALAKSRSEASNRFFSFF